MEESRIIGRCIYCRSTDNLSDEHVIPYGLGSTWVLRKASCRQCASITSGFEREVLRPMLGEFRAALGIQTRRKAERPKTSELKLERRGVLEPITIPVGDCVQLLPLPVFPPPGYFRGRDLTERLKTRGIEVNYIGAGKSRALGRASGADAVRRPFSCRPLPFARLICKIAHGAAVAKFGLDGFKEFFLLPAILEGDDRIGYYIGSGHLAPQSSGEDHTVVLFAGDSGLVVAQVDLFSRIAGTSYLALVGRLNTEAH